MQQKESSMFNEDIYRQKNGRGLAKDLQKSSEETKCTCNPAQRYGPKITDKKKKKAAGSIHRYYESSGIMK